MTWKADPHYGSNILDAIVAGTPTDHQHLGGRLPSPELVREARSEVHKLRGKQREAQAEIERQNAEKKAAVEQAEREAMFAKLPSREAIAEAKGELERIRGATTGEEAPRDIDLPEDQVHRKHLELRTKELSVRVSAGLPSAEGEL